MNKITLIAIFPNITSACICIIPICHLSHSHTMKTLLICQVQSAKVQGDKRTRRRTRRQRRGGHVTSPTVESPMNRHRPRQWGQPALRFGSLVGGPASLFTSQSCVGVIVVRRTHRPHPAPRFLGYIVPRFPDASAPRAATSLKNDASQALIFPICPSP